VAECNGTVTTTCTHTLTSGRGIFVIPGAEITYHWEIEDADGGRMETADQLYVHEDTRFEFQTLTRGNITLYYHSGGESQAEAVLDAAVEAFERVGTLAQTEVTFPVKVFLYETASEMQPAIAPAGNGRGVQILGEVVYSDTAMVSVENAPLDITRHEIAHIVTREATKGPFGIPDWMNEGISVYAQNRPLAGHGAALENAIENDAVLNYRELNSSSAGGSASTVGLYYGQSGDIVRFLVETYGEERFAELLRTFKEGSRADAAFEEVYGFDQLGLENAWRESVGLEPRVEAARTPVPGASQEARALPTSAGSDTTASEAGDDGDGTSAVTIAIISGLTLALLAVIGGAYLVVRSRV
jgi:hypothetical protein